MIIMKKLTLLFTILISLHLFAEPQHGVVYVVPNGTGTGASWSDALGNIQEAITLVRSQNPAARKDVWVAAGEFEISTAINITDSVNVYGSFAGTEAAVSERTRPVNARLWEFLNPTILKGNGARLMQSAGNLDMETVIDGFIMQNGNGLGSTLNTFGGAIIVRAEVVFQNCILRNNSATGGGGGAHMTGGTIRHCLIENNSQVTNANGGGGIFTNSNSGFSSYIENCVIRGNSSTIRGAGIGIQGSAMIYVSNLEIYNNISIDGTTLKSGAGIYSNSSNNRVINCLIYNNTGGSVVYFNGGNLYNNTIVKNVGGVYLAGNIVNAANNIVWGCATDVTGTTPTSISGVANTTWSIKNNGTYIAIPTDKGWDIDENIQFSSNTSNGDVSEPLPGTVGSGPKFEKVSSFIGVSLNEDQQANLDSVNWSLNTSSPCVDAGMVVESVIEDFAGYNRPQGFPVETASFDIGAYELPYFLVLAGEAETANGYVYSAMGELLPENFTYGYAKGSLFELYFEPKAGYKIDKAYYIVSNDGGLTFKGEQVDFTNQIDQDGFWSTHIQTAFKVQVDWVSLTSVKKLDDSSIQCFGTENGIQINGVSNGDLIRVYNISGMLVNKISAHEGQTFVAVPKGMYIVRLAQGVQKVLVK